MDFKEHIQREIKALVFKDTLMIGIVESVDKPKSICSVRLLEDDGLVIPNVRLQAIDSEQDNGWLIFPKVGTTVILGKLDNINTFFVAMFSEVEEIYLKVDGVEKLKITKDEIIFDEGTKGSLVEIGKLVSRMNLIENKVNSIISTFNSHVHPETGSTTSTTATPVSGTLSTTNASNLENDKIKQ
jgi:hypothetical protein